MLSSTQITVISQHTENPFEEEFADWRTTKGELTSGTQIAAMVTFEKNSSGKPFMVAANAGCSADAFLPTGLAVKDEELLTQLLGTTANVALTVRSKVGRQYCHGHKYEVEPRFTVVPLPLNPTHDELLEFRHNAHVIIEGVFAGYFEYIVQDSIMGYVSRVGFNIDTPNGKVKIQTHFGGSSDRRTTYSDGVIENLKDKEMSEGEIVRVTAFVTQEHTLHSGYNSTFLAAPSQERQGEYDELRRAVVLLVNEFESATTNKQYRLARSLFAQLRRLELTHNEQQHIQQVMMALPRHEQSIYRSRYTADDLARAFNVDVESLNRAQFLTFAFEVVRGVRKNPEDKTLRTDQSYLFSYLLIDSPVFTHREKVSLLRASLSARLKRLESRTDEHDDFWDDRYTLERTISYARYIDDPAIVRDIEGLVEYCISMERQPVGTPRRMSFLLSDALDTIEEWKRRGTSSARITRRRAEKWRQQLESFGDGWHIAKLNRLIERL